MIILKLKLSTFGSIIHLLEDLQNILTKFSPISLQEMDEVKLLNRTDTKYVLSIPQLFEILKEISDNYSILEIENNRLNSYKTLYFDTIDKRFYLNHHNGKPNRYKVRMRKYVDSGLCFLEVKFKSKGRTDKKRQKIKDFKLELSAKKNELIAQIFKSSMELEPSIWNSFSRLTLVNKKEKERLTLDLNLNFASIDESKQVALEHLVIAEVKQENINRNSIFVKKAKEMGIRSSSMSKYCIGMALLNENLKSNRFKSKILNINKLKKAS